MVKKTAKLIYAFLIILSSTVYAETKLGAEIEDGEDWILIHGKGGKNLHGGIVESFDDHRIAMALSVLGFALNDGECVEVKDAECCKVSFPGFFEKMSSIGAKFN